MNCIQCNKDIPEDCKWCSIECKETFYKEEYMGSVLAKNLEILYEQEKDRKRIEDYKKYTEWKKYNPNGGRVEYIQTFGRIG